MFNLIAQFSLYHCSLYSSLPWLIHISVLNTSPAPNAYQRCGEFTVPDRHSFDPTIHLTRSSITFIPSLAEPTHIRLTLPSSKTDPFRKGVSILVARALSEGESDSTCAVLALQRLFLQDPQPSSNSPLFTDGTGSPLCRSLIPG